MAVWVRHIWRVATRTKSRVDTLLRTALYTAASRNEAALAMEQHKMARLTKANVKSLAVNYHAYLTALDKGMGSASDCNSIIVWGQGLLEAQAATGVVVANETLVRENVEQARKAETAM